MAGSAVVVAGASHPYPDETCNGDAWVVDWWEGRCRLAVVDGLGHGPAAAEAAQRAIATLVARPDMDAQRALEECHRALAGSRGAAMLVACIDPARAHLAYAGIGNVESSLWVRGRRQRLISYRGIVGVTTQRVRSFVIALDDDDWLLLVHTDGVSARLDISVVAADVRADPQRLADSVLARWGRTNDDATVVVACSP